MIPFLLFTDLDGTLLDHHSYRADAAIPALQLLEKAGVPVVFCSSKTMEEQRFLQKQLGIKAPFIAENGSAVCWPADYFLSAHQSAKMHWEGYAVHPFSPYTRAEICAFLDTLGHKQPVAGYSNMSEADLEQFTGLTGKALHRANQRLFTETLTRPTLEETSAAYTLKRSLARHRLTLTRGGRFWTVQASGINKGTAVKWLSRLYRQATGSKIPVVAIGDSANDQPMLKAANMAFLVRNHRGQWADMDMKHLVRLNHKGPEGFAEAVDQLRICM